MGISVYIEKEFMIERISGFLIFLTLAILIAFQAKYFDFAIPTAILGLFVSAVGLFLTRKGTLVFPKKITLLFVLFLLSVFISAIFSKVPEESFQSLIFYSSSFFIFLIGFNLAGSDKKFINLWQYSLFAFGTAIVLYSIISEYPQISSGKQFVGPFYWYNQMAGFLMYLIPLPLVLFLVGKKKLLWGSLSLFLLGSFVLTYSRASWFSLILALTPLIFLARKAVTQNKKILAIFVISFAILIPLIFSFGFLGSRVKSIVSELRGETRTPSGNLRIASFRSAIEIFKDNPAFGVGPGVFGEAGRAYQKLPWLYAKYTHNHFLQILSETGLIGLILFASLFVSTFSFIFKKRNALSKNEFLGALVISLIASFIHNLFDVDWNWPALSLLFWFSLGLLLGSISEKSETWEPKSKKSLGIALAFLFISSLYLFSVERTLQRLTLTLSGSEVDLSKASSSLKFLRNAPFYSSYYLASGNLSRLTEKYDEALSSFKKAETLNPFSAEPIYSQAQVLEFKREFTTAEDKYREAIKLNPFTEVKYYQGAAEMATAKLDLDEAENILSEGAEAFPYNESFKGFSYLYEFTGFNKDVSKLHTLYADLLFFHGKTDEAQGAVIEAQLFDPANSEAQNLEKIIEARIKK